MLYFYTVLFSYSEPHAMWHQTAVKNVEINFKTVLAVHRRKLHNFHHICTQPGVLNSDHKYKGFWREG